MDVAEAAVLRLLRGELPTSELDLNADNLLSLILYHRIHPSVSAVLASQRAPLPPWASDLEQRLLECRLLETRAWRRKDNQAQRIAEAFASRGIDGLFVKGYALAKAIYPDPLQRAFGDIDIWVAPKEFPAASEALSSVGYRAWPLHRWSDPVEQTFVETLDKEAVDELDVPIEVDLHWAFAGRHGPQRFVRLDMSGIRERGFLACPGMRFARVGDEIILEACHLVRSSFCPLSAYIDLRALVDQSPDWSQVWREAEVAGVATALHAGLALSTTLLGYELPNGAFPNRSWPSWQRALLLPRLSIKKIVRLDRLHEPGARFALKYLCQDSALRVLASLACLPVDIASRLAGILMRSHSIPS